jgi:hypothetical protein
MDMFVNVAHSMTRELEEKPILARTHPDFEGYLNRASESNVPTAFLNAYSKLVNRLTREGKIRGQGELTLPRATPIWKQIAYELLEFDFYTPELARICVSYSLNVATAKLHLEKENEYQTGVIEIRSDLETVSAEAKRLLEHTQEQYPDTGDLLMALATDPTLSEAKAAYDKSVEVITKLAAFESSHGSVAQKLQASSVFYFVWHEKRVLEISPKRTWYGKVIDAIKRTIYNLPTLDQYKHWIAHVEAYFGNSQKRGRILHRAS